MTDNSNVVRLVPRPRPLRADVPPFDPNNDVHLRAWESLFDFSRRELGQREARS